MHLAESQDWAAADAAAKQQALIDNCIGWDGQANGAAKNLVAASARSLTDPAVWSAPDGDAPSLYETVYPLRAQWPHRRVLVDSVLTESEAKYFTHEALDGFGDAMFGDIDEDNDEGDCAVAWPDWGPHPLNEHLCSVVCAKLRLHWDERRPLFLAGALLIRMTASSTRSPAHVDKANIGYYDYSAVVYLNTQNDHFAGGSFHFIDAAGIEVVEPRAGRCLLFASGAEHLHQVQPVTSGQRFAIGMWFTLTPDCGTALPML